MIQLLLLDASVREVTNNNHSKMKAIRFELSPFRRTTFAATTKEPKGYLIGCERKNWFWIVKDASQNWGWSVQKPGHGRLIFVRAEHFDKASHFAVHGNILMLPTTVKLLQSAFPATPCGISVAMSSRKQKRCSFGPLECRLCLADAHRAAHLS